MAIFNGKIHYKWPFSIAMLNYQRVIPNQTPQGAPAPQSSFFFDEFGQSFSFLQALEFLGSKAKDPRWDPVLK